VENIIPPRCCYCTFVPVGLVPPPPGDKTKEVRGANCTLNSEQNRANWSIEGPKNTIFYADFKSEKI